MPPPAALKQMPGYLSVASDVVKCDATYRQIIENLLGRTVVVDSVEHAVGIANKTNHRHKLVTLGGEVMMPGGAMVGGKTKDEDEGVLKRKTEIDKLTVALQQLRKEYEDKLAQKSVFLTQIESLQKKCDEYQAHYDDLRQKNAAKLEQIKLKNQQAEKLSRSIADSKKQLEQLGNSIASDKSTLLVKESDCAKLQLTLISARDELTNLSSGGYKEDLVEVSNLRNQAEIEYVRAKESVSQWEERLANIDEKQELLHDQKRLKEEQIEHLQEEITQLRQQIEYYTEIDRDYDGARKELDERYARLMDRKKKANEQYIAVNDKIIACNKERIAVAEQLSKIEVSVSKVESEMEHLQIGMMEDYSLTYASALEFKKELKDYNQSVTYVSDLKDRIRKLGNINVESLDEYKEVKERFESMCTQRDDLISAKEELIKIIRDISVSMVHQFMQQFELIQTEFNDVFMKLFNGGEARLILTDPEDVMESGIDIIAQPPKTKLKNIAALSGGEKSMTAVSLIFAILKIKPSPFCVLDEIDAALDDANAMRFCEYLMSIKKNNQFVIITHKKKTMEIVDVLYGASMGKDGITQVFSVKMSQIGEKGEVYAG
jgi:chromosome segregation protein